MKIKKPPKPFRLSGFGGKNGLHAKDAGNKAESGRKQQKSYQVNTEI
jgi:hypothetical protein